MTEWCTAHPWMTFFICLSALNALHVIRQEIKR